MGIPALILVVLATPSFTLLYSMDELIDPVINFKIIVINGIGRMSYQTTRCVELNQKIIILNMIVICLDSLAENKKGYYRLLETNKRLLFPSNTHLRLFISAADVLHSWTVPSFGVKV